MARRGPAYPPADKIRALADNMGRLPVRVTPNASGDAIALPPENGDGVLQIRTTATPEDGKANEAVLRLLSDALRQPVSNINLVRGVSTRNKVVKIGSASGPDIRLKPPLADTEQ